jgi:hypothetical protein
MRHLKKPTIVIVTKLHSISHSSLECKYFLGMHDVPINIHYLNGHFTIVTKPFTLTIHVMKMNNPTNYLHIIKYTISLDVINTQLHATKKSFIRSYVQLVNYFLILKNERISKESHQCNSKQMEMFVWNWNDYLPKELIK